MPNKLKRAAALAALALGVSACASSKEWQTWSEHTTHFASSQHLGFSKKNSDPRDPRIGPADVKTSEDERWWGAYVPPGPPVNVAGRWRGTWSGANVFGGPRGSQAEITLAQEGYYGNGRLFVRDGLAALSMPPTLRRMDLSGVDVVYSVSGEDVRIEHAAGRGLFTISLVLVGDRLVGFADNGADGMTRFEFARAE